MGYNSGNSVSHNSLCFIQLYDDIKKALIFNAFPIIINNELLADAKMLVICMSVSWVVLEWYLSHDFIVGNKNLSSCKSVYYVLYKCCFLLFSQVTYQYTFVI